MNTSKPLRENWVPRVIVYHGVKNGEAFHKVCLGSIQSHLMLKERQDEKCIALLNNSRSNNSSVVDFEQKQLTVILFFWEERMGVFSQNNFSLPAHKARCTKSPCPSALQKVVEEGMANQKCYGTKTIALLHGETTPIGTISWSKKK